MKFNWEKFSGVFLFWLGVLIFLNSFTGITGYVISENFSKVENFSLGIFLIIFGIVIFLVSERQERESQLVGRVRIVETNHFQRAAKKHLEQARKAAEKIGTGKGKEEKLRGREGYSIRAPSGDRIIFVYDKTHTEATLTDYVSDDNYRN